MSTIDEVLLTLGLLHEVFYDSLRGADPEDIARLEAAAGLTLTTSHRQLLELAGASLGPLRIPDWRGHWDFRPRTLVEVLESRAPDERASLVRTGHVPVARMGEPYGFTGPSPACLLLDTATGELVSDDPARDDVYDSLEALLLEWGHRLLDPRMASRVGRARLLHRPEPHALAAAAEPVEVHVGGRLGVYRFHDSGLLIKAKDDALEVEARRAHRADPERCAAARVLDAVVALGAAQLDR